MAFADELRNASTKLQKDRISEYYTRSYLKYLCVFRAGCTSAAEEGKHEFSQVLTPDNIINSGYYEKEHVERAKQSIIEELSSDGYASLSVDIRKVKIKNNEYTLFNIKRKRYNYRYQLVASVTW